VIHSLRDVASNVCWPNNNNLNRIKEEFKGKAGMPDVIGTIDDSHIEIEAPKVHIEICNKYIVKIYKYVKNELYKN